MNTLALNQRRKLCAILRVVELSEGTFTQHHVSCLRRQFFDCVGSQQIVWHKPEQHLLALTNVHGCGQPSERRVVGCGKLPKFGERVANKTGLLSEPRRVWNLTRHMLELVSGQRGPSVAKGYTKIEATLVTKFTCFKGRRA